jgi:hypothetical protein
MFRSVLLAVALVALAGCLSESTRPGPSLEVTRITPSAPQPVYYSRLSDPTRLVIRDARTFAEFWARAFENPAGAPEVPQVNFADEVVIAAALGVRASGGFEIRVGEVIESRGEVAVEIISSSPGRGCVVSMALTQPLDIVKVSTRAAAYRFIERSVVHNCSAP